MKTGYSFQAGGLGHVFNTDVLFVACQHGSLLEHKNDHLNVNKLSLKNDDHFPSTSNPRHPYKEVMEDVIFYSFQDFITVLL